MELEQGDFEFKPPRDPRPRMPEPLPVKLIAVEDLRLTAPAGIEPQLDAFYGALLGFEREPRAEQLTYHAENFSLRFDVVEPPVERDEYRMLKVEVKSLAEAQRKLSEAQIEHTRQRGLMPGTVSIVLLDPAGNWVEILESRAIG